MAAINKRKLLESAQKNLQKGALDKALKDYQELLAADPRDTNVRLKVGDLQLKRGNADEAIAAYLKVADQFMRDGFDARAVAIYKQVTKIDAKRFDIYIPLADLYQRIGLTTDAMAALQTAAEAYQRDGRRREALDLLRRMASLDPTNTTSRLKVAELLHQEGLADEAIAEFDATAAELARQGDWEARASVLQRLLELAPERHETYESLIVLWLERNQAGRAEPLARKLVSLDETRAESQETLAGVLRARGDEKGAIDAYRAAADAWIARGDEARAREILQRQVPSEPFDGGAVAAGAITNPIAESPFGEEGIGGEPPPTVDEFRFVDDGASAPIASADDDFELEFDDAPPAAAAPVPKPAPPAAAPSNAAKTVVRELRTAPAPKPVAAPAPAPSIASAAPDSGDGVVADVEQLLAEAAVYLRYGKHERALASLERALVQEPRHLGALEQLGDAHLRAENAAEAVAVWTRAHGIALSRSDTERASALHARIESVDAAAAAALAAPAPASRGAAAATVLFDAPLSEPEPLAADAQASGEGDLGEIEIDVDDEELGASGAADADDPSSAEAAAPEETNDAAGTGAGFEIEIDTAAFDASDADAFAAPASESDGVASASAPATDDVPVPDSFVAADEAPSEVADAAADAPAFDDSIEIEDAQSGASEAALASETPTTEAAEQAVETAPTPAPPTQAVATAPAAKSDGSEVSTTTSQQIVEDLEEASFYFEQGLLDEAEAIYRRVVEHAPRHPGALLRLGEIAVARGQDPSRSAAAETTSAPPDAGAQEAAPTIDPPDDLDLTAREFGPQSTWEADAEAAEDPVAAEAETPVDEGASGGDDETFDRTDPADWTTPDTEELESVGAAAAAAASAVEAQPTPESGKEEATLAPGIEPEPAQRPEPVAASEPPPLELTAPEIRAEEDGAPAFDLAAELSEALRDEPATPARSSATDEDGFASLFREFKRGVSRTLDEGDVETHFDLGIAYREMGLLDDAIGEFHYALGSSARRLDALHMMGLCALDIGRAADAVGHLEQALASPDVPSEREVPLRYDLARAYEVQGDRERAIDAMARVVELDATFQDAPARLEALRSDALVEDEPVEAAPAPEAYESFDDLIAQTADEASDDAGEGAAAAPAETYESFDEFHDDDASEVETAAAGESENAVEAEPSAAEPVEAAAEQVAALEDAPADDVVEAPASEPEPEPTPAPEPSPPDETPRRRRKISFF